MPSPPRATRILILDDEPGILEVLGHYLRSLGFDPVPTARWTEALDVITHKVPDLILLDLNMPTIQGDAILAHIQQLERPIPVIIVSAHLDPERVEKVLRLGARRCIHKPFQLSEVAAVIREELGLPADSPAPVPSEPPTPEDTGGGIFTALDQELTELAAAGKRAAAAPEVHHSPHPHHSKHRKSANLKLYIVISLVCVLATAVVLVLQKLPEWMSGTFEQAMEKSVQSEIRRQAKEKGVEGMSDKQKEALRKALESK
jgi:CheY-like chemotaxis protein